MFFPKNWNNLGMMLHARISALGSLKQEDHKFEASLSYNSELLSQNKQTMDEPGNKQRKIKSKSAPF